MYASARYRFCLSNLKVAEEQTPSYYEVPNRRVGGFVGREDILQKIDEALFGKSVPHYAVLQGIGGQGKSQVALEYCHRKKDNPYSAIFWVDATTEDTVKRSFQSMSERIEVRTDYLPDINARVAFVLRILTSWTVKWLMVFDNYDNPDAFPNIRDFIPQSEHGAMLVTSRHPDSNALVINQSNHFIELLGLEEIDAVALLTQQSQTNQAISTDAKTIVERLGCHPLAITQAGAYIRKRKLGLCEFMDHYNRRRRIILENTPQLSVYRKRLGNAEKETSMNVFTTWELSFQQLQSQVSENSIEAKLLTLFAFFDEKDISEQLFVEFDSRQEEMSESAKLLIWLNAFSNASGQWESDLFTDALIRLRDSSLLQAFTRESDGFHHSSLHPLIKDWIRLRTNESISRENTYMAATLVKEILVHSWQKQHFKLALLTRQRITSHIIALEESYEEYANSQTCIRLNQKILDEYISSQFWFARFLFKAGLYPLAETINHRINAQNEKILGPDHPNTLASMGNLASIYQNQGRWEEAEELEVQVIERRKRVLGVENPDTLTSMECLASTYRDQGRWKEAEELGIQLIETSVRVLGLEHPDTLTSMGNLASTFWNQGRWEEAEELDVQVMNSRKVVLGPEHPDTLISMGSLASTYWNQGRGKEAEELDVQVMETSLRVLGPDHPSTLTSISSLASTYWNQRRWEEAEKLDVQVMETRKRVLGLEHPDTLTGMSNLASTYRNQDRWEEAEQLGMQVMQTRKRLLGPDHPSTLTSMSKLAFTFWTLGRRNSAIQLMGEVVQSRRGKIGPDHPDTLRSRRTLRIWRARND